MQRKDADQGRRRSTERSAVSRRASVQCLLHDYVNQDCRRPAVEFVLVSAQRCSPVRCVTSAQRQSGSSLTSPDGPSRKAAGKLRCRNAAEATASASIGLDLPALGYPAAGDRGPASVAPSGRSCFSLQVRCRRSLGAAADCGRCPANATGPRSSAWPTNAPAARPVAHGSHAYATPPESLDGRPAAPSPGQGAELPEPGFKPPPLQKVLPNLHARPILH
jgi:hypothetical protein